jgi:hypothetical protein
MQSVKRGMGHGGDGKILDPSVVDIFLVDIIMECSSDCNKVKV